MKGHITKLLAVLLALVMVAALVPGTALAEEETDTWDGKTADTKWYDEHTGEDTFTIKTAEELAGLATLVNNGNGFHGKTINLDINIALDNKEWTPIGDPNPSINNTFRGTFNGQDHTISNLTIISHSNPGLGLFGDLSAKKVSNSRQDAGTVQNLTICNATITGQGFIGAFVGGGNGISPYYGNSGNIKNCHLTGKVQLSASSGYIGGIVGKLAGDNDFSYDINGCTVDASEGSFINGNSGSYVGGIVGYRNMINRQHQNTTDCHVSGVTISGGSCVGGISGNIEKYNTIKDCSVDNITVKSTKNDGTVGLIAGQICKTSAAADTTTLPKMINCSADAASTVTVADDVLEDPPLVGQNGKPVLVGTNVELDGDGKITKGAIELVGDSSGKIKVEDLFADEVQHSTDGSGKYFVGTQYKVTYDKGGESGATNMPGAGTALEGSPYTVSAQVPKTGYYYFGGWKSSADNQIYMSGESIESITGEITLTAQWIDQDDFSDLANPTWKIEPEHYQSSTTEITLTCTFTNNTGETFIDDRDDGMHLAIQTFGSTKNDGLDCECEIISQPKSVSPRETVEIVSKLTFQNGLADFWDEINYELHVSWWCKTKGTTHSSNFYTTITRAPDSVVTVSFDDGVDGETGEVTGMPDAFKVEKGGSAKLPEDTPSREGYTFTGWSDGNGNTYREGNTIESVSGDMTLTAQWKEVPEGIDKVESLISEPEVTFPEGSTVKPEDQKALTEAAQSTAIDQQHMNELANKALADPNNELPASTEEAKNALEYGEVQVTDLENITVVVQTYIEVKVDNYTPAAEGKTAALTYDITPKYRVVATTADDPSEIHLEGAHKNAVVLGDEHELPVNEPVTLTLGLPENFVDETTSIVYIQHKDVYEYEGIVSADKKTVTFTNPHGFSTFAISLTRQAAAEIGGTSYMTLQDAVNAVKDGEEITVLTGNPLTATAPAKNVTFTVENGDNVTIQDNGNYHVSRSGNTYTVTYVAPPVPTTPTPSNPDKPDEPDTDPVDVFVDVPAGVWYRDALNYVLENTDGVINGTDVTHFSPNEKLTRAAFAKILWAIEGSKPTTADNPFTDVKSGDWFYDAVIWANAQGIMLGKGENLCAPNDNITREEMALMIQRWKAGKAAGEVAFPDAKDVHDWAADAVAWAAEQSYIKGKDDGRFAPLDPLTRAEMITVVARTLGFEG